MKNNLGVLSVMGAVMSIGAHGLLGAARLAGDYDGDGKSDLLVWRPSNATWYLMPSTGRCPSHFLSSPPYRGQTVCVRQHGLPGDVPLFGDFTGDGIDDLVTWRSDDETVYLLASSRSCPYRMSRALTPDGKSVCKMKWPGRKFDIVMTGDFNGDKVSDLGFVRLEDRRWTIRPTARHPWSLAVYPPPSLFYDQVPDAQDIPTWTSTFVLPEGKLNLGDYDGDGITDTGVSQNGKHYFLPSSWGTPFVRRCPYTTEMEPFVPGYGICTQSGAAPQELAASADFDGDGKWELTSIYPSDFRWGLLPTRGLLIPKFDWVGTTLKGELILWQRWGLPKDFPVQRDIDGDGKADVFVFRPIEGIWYAVPSTGTCPVPSLPFAGFSWDGKAFCSQQFGAFADVPATHGVGPGMSVAAQLKQGWIDLQQAESQCGSLAYADIALVRLQVGEDKFCLPRVTEDINARRISASNAILRRVISWRNAEFYCPYMTEAEKNVVRQEPRLNGQQFCVAR